MCGAAPPVSVVLPVRNGGAFFAEALDSLSGQTFTDFEVVIQDDGSTDGSVDVAQDVARRDKRFRVHAGPPRGVAFAANSAFERARGDLIVRMDADDLARPGRVEALVAFAREHPDVGYFGSRVAYFPRKAVGPGMLHYETWVNSLVTHEQIFRDRFVEYPLPHPSTAVRREVHDALKGYRHGRFPEDYDFFLRAAEAGVTFGKHPDVLLDWREGPHRTTKHDDRYRLERFFDLKLEYLVPHLQRLGRDVGVVGAGRDGKRLAKALIAAWVPVRCFVDVNPRRVGAEIQGARVIGYDDLPGMRTCFFLCAVGQKGAREEVRRALWEKGFEEERDFLCVQ